MTDDAAARWNTRYRGLETEASSAALELRPPASLRRLEPFLPAPTVAVDLAGGNGGGALWLAERGFDPVLVDVSDVALTQASDVAALRSLPLRTACVDLAGWPLATILDEVPADVGLVTCFHYLNRALLSSIGAGLPPGAVFMAAIATETNLERNARPSARFLLKPGELAALVLGDGSPGTELEVLHSNEGWTDTGHHEAELVVRRSGASTSVAHTLNP